ncbi:MAG: hypothetical protein AABX11_01835 [Nanoarchaeota archaeon]
MDNMAHHKYRTFEWGKVLGVPLVPQFRTFWQKSSTHNQSGFVFKPLDYESENAQERVKMAYQDAKNHQRFYEDLVKSGVYPPNTNVKVKRLRHSHQYHLEISMPDVKHDLRKYLRDRDFNFSDQPMPNNNEMELENEVQGIINRVKSIAEKRKYSYKHYKHSFRRVIRDVDGDFHPDLTESHNYRVDGRGRTFYVDVEILKTKLPFKGRKESVMEEDNHRLKERSEQTLEGRVDVLISIVGLLLGIALLSSNIRGNITGNIIGIAQNDLNWIVGVFFLIGLIGVFWRLRK